VSVAVYLAEPVAVSVAVYVCVGEYNNYCKHVQDLDALGVFLYVAVAVPVAVSVAVSVAAHVGGPGTMMRVGTCKILMR